MPYDEKSFLNGLAAGLCATSGYPAGVLDKRRTTGTGRMIYKPDECDIYVSKFIFDEGVPYPTTILYEFGTDAENLERVYRRVGASAEPQTFYHVVQFPTTLSMADYHYNVFFFKRKDIDTVISYDSMFMSFPYTDPDGRDNDGLPYPYPRDSQGRFLYPGSPELVHHWWTRTYLT